MLGTIENLEKEIEQFQKNMAASGELVQLLKQMLEQIKQQNNEFEEKSQALIRRVDGIPSAIADANAVSNSQVKSDVAMELDMALQKFILEQDKYMQGLDLTRQQILNYVEQIHTAESTFLEHKKDVLDKVESVKNAIEDENKKSNARLTESVSGVMEESVRSFVREQEVYISGLEKTQARIDQCEEILSIKYKEFVDSLEKMNSTNLYEQNVQLKRTLEKRTRILMILLGLSVILEILGIFL